jgi:hypothetical protein
MILKRSETTLPQNRLCQASGDIILPASVIVVPEKSLSVGGNKRDQREAAHSTCAKAAGGTTGTMGRTADDGQEGGSAIRSRPGWQSADNGVLIHPSPSGKLYSCDVIQDKHLSELPVDRGRLFRIRMWCLIKYW